MVLNINNETIIDIDRVSAISPSCIIVDGYKMNIYKEDMKAIKRAYYLTHNSHMYDQDGNIMRGKEY